MALDDITAFMKKLLAALLLFTSIHATAQRKNRHTPIITEGVYLSFNPHALLEPEQGAVGLGIGYRFNKRIEAWVEGSYLYPGIVTESDFTGLKGFRAIASGKYFYQNKYGFFVGAEFRLKKYSFEDQATFTNVQTGTTLTNYSYKAEHTLIGGGVFWGKRFKITGDGKFELEGNIGIGVKHRIIRNKNVPDGYSREIYRAADVFFADRDAAGDMPYLPATVRFIYHL
jgi:hypothetical protein